MLCTRTGSGRFSDSSRRSRAASAVVLMEPRKPIFVIGAGRSGSSIFGDVLAKHPRLAYLTPLSHRYPDKVWLNHRAMRLADGD